MASGELPLNQVITGDSLEVLGQLPDESIDVVFADPPYNLRLEQELWRPNQTLVDAVTEAWDQFDDDKAYTAFTTAWLKDCKRVLKKNGTLWVIGSYHNIYRVGAIMQDLGFWFLNDIVWVKTNPMPNFRGVRFTNAHETLLWATRTKNAHYTFNHHAMKSLNDDMQMRSDWLLPVCKGPERIKIDGKRAHPTQKPEALLYRVILSSSKAGDVILDPFFGTGTTGVVAKKLGRNWIGIEKDPRYAYIAEQRIRMIGDVDLKGLKRDPRDVKRLEPRISFGALLENGLLRPGDALYFKGDKEIVARVKLNGKLLIDGYEGSIHQAGRYLQNNQPTNGWEHWHYADEKGQLHPIDELRSELRKIMLSKASDQDL